MGKKSIDLMVATDPRWVDVVLAHFDAFLCDHANCERKASALAMSLVVKYADRVDIIPTLIALAQEELEHFGQVYALMAARKLQLANDTQDPYVNALIGLMRHGREVRLLDRMLVASIIECRGAERFGLIAEALTEPQLKAFYTNLWRAEVKHGHQFADLAYRLYPNRATTVRLSELTGAEAEILRSLPLRPALH